MKTNNVSAEDKELMKQYIKEEIESSKAFSKWIPGAKKQFGDFGALILSEGLYSFEEALFNAIKEMRHEKPGKTIKQLAKRDNWYLGCIWLDLALPEQFANCYDLAFISKLYSVVCELKKKVKSGLECPKSVAEELILYLGTQIAYENLRDVAPNIENEAVKQWFEEKYNYNFLFDLFGDDDIECLFDDANEIDDQSCYYISKWFDDQFWQ